MARFRFVAFAAAASLGANQLDAQVTSTRAKKPLPTEDSLAAITERGRRLAEYDAAAWIAGDTMAARKPDIAMVPQYVARKLYGRWVVTFGRLAAARDTFFIAYEVKQIADGQSVYSVEAPQRPRPDVDYYLRASRALVAAKVDFGRPSRPYNAAVLEQPDGTFFVYLMPAQLQQGIFPLGADVRYHYTADGSTLITKRQLHKALIEGRPQAQPGSTLEAGTHTAILDDIPEDTDVFHVIVREPHIPEYIVTDAFLFFLYPDGRIKNLGRREEVLGPSKKP